MIAVIVITLTVLFTLAGISPLLITDDVKDIVEIGSNRCS